MKYHKFTIENFRCFSEVQTLKFANPVAGKPGSGITYVVGANNSGKTTLIEGIWLRKDQKIKSSEKKMGLSPKFCLYGEDEKLLRKLSLIRPESYTLGEDPCINEINQLFEIVTSRRHWDSAAQSNSTSEQIITSSSQGHNPRIAQNIPTASILRDIEKDTTKYDEFTKLVQQIIPEFTQWAVAYEDHEYIEYISGDNIKHKTDFLGDGVISVIRILAHLFEGRQTGLIIDEPELSLHPLAQKKLIKLIAKYSQTRQIIISTHSPYFVSWEYIKNGAILNRVSKTGDKSSKINTIKEFNKYSKLINGENWQQPYLMDVASKEIFFQDNILFVEGQEDVGLLQDFFTDYDVNFFGYGVRGFSNFEFALQLANDLVTCPGIFRPN